MSTSASPSRKQNNNNNKVKQPPLRIGMIGGGTVGGGVYELIMGRLRQTKQQQQQQQCQQQQQQCRQLIITKVCVQDLSKPRSFHLDDDLTKLTTHVENIYNDPDIDMVIEVMGNSNKSTTNTNNNNNMQLVKTILESALRNQKMVVSANTAVIAEHVDDIQQLAAANNARFGFEAAVCGGIPIVQTLQSSYSGDVIHQIQGIFNATTNHMLIKMMEQGNELEKILQDDASSQDFSEFTEADPSIDIEGYDVRSKVCLLAKLAFGVTVPPKQVPCKGISNVTSVDCEYAKLLGCTIKLVGTARRLHEAREWDGPLCVFVSPVLVPTNHILATMTSNNGITVTSANLGTCCYLGPGAGRFPAAHSIVADVVRLANGWAGPTFPFHHHQQQQQHQYNHHHHHTNDDPEQLLELDYDYTSAFYIRIPFSDGLGIIKKVGELSEQAGVSIHSILQNPIRDRLCADFCVTTEQCLVSQVEELCHLLNDEQEFCRAPCVFMPLLVEEE